MFTKQSNGKLGQTSQTGLTFGGGKIMGNVARDDSAIETSLRYQGIWLVVSNMFYQWEISRIQLMEVR